jgi:membrane-bound ClpP family serine protease
MIAVIIGLILLGILLIILELLVIPGTTIVGFLGMILMGIGVYLSYTNISTTVGHFVLSGSILFFVISIIFALRSKTWNKAALNNSIDSKVTLIETDPNEMIGKTAITISRLNPVGKINFNGEYYEAKSYYNIIEPNTEVEIINIEGNSLIVKPKNK